MAVACIGSGISQRAAAARTQGPWRWLVCGPIGLGRYAQQDRVRVKAGETYRQPQATGRKLQAASRKQQATSLTTCPGYDRMDLERKI